MHRSILALLVTTCWLLLRVSPALALEFYIAPDGKDTNPGTRAQPFATLEAARDALRSRGSAPGHPREPATVWLRAGTYVRERTFELGPNDSGTKDAPSLYRSMDGETVRLIGGQVLRKFAPVTDDAIRSRLDPLARAQVVQANLRDAGITSFGSIRSRGFGRSAGAAHLELFFNGVPMTLARWPNEGEWERIAGFPEDSSKGDDHGGKIGALTGGFHYSGDRPARWKSAEDIWVHGYWAWDWANSYERVESLDTRNRLLKTAEPRGHYGFRKGQRFYFLNVLEELDQPGEWFLDRTLGILYFWPPNKAQDQPGLTAADEVLVSVVEIPLVSLVGASHITLRGFDLEAGRGDGILIQGGANNLVAGCGIRLMGKYGVRIDGGTGHQIVACDIENTGDGGVEVNGGDRKTLHPGGHLVENCHFQKQGRWSKCYVPSVLLGGVGHRVRNNLIHDHPHCAILFTGNDHQIEFNEIHHIALETGDVGAIYTGRDWTFRGNQIRYNYIHHTGGVGMGSMGAYMDDCVSGTEIVGNIFYKVTRAAFLGGGRDHKVENNLFIECEPAVQVDGRGMDKSPVWHGMVYGFMKRQLDAVPHALYREKYPAISAVDRQYQSGTNGIPPEGNVVARNVSLGGKWLSIGWHAKPEMVNVQSNYVSADTHLLAPEQRQFTLPPDSPAWNIGFTPIPFQKIGLQESADRRRKSTP